MLFDNSGATPALIASMAQGSTAIMQEAGYRALIEKYGKS
jgi:hypothetical protein